MESIEQELQPFLKNPNFVFKSCREKFLVILKKINNTKTNEERKVFDLKYAKYRGSRFIVVTIINKFDPTIKIDSLESSSHEDDNLDYSAKCVVYKVGEIVESDGFDSDLTKVCGKGIHYFTTPEPAYYYDLEYFHIKNGLLKTWHENGCIESIAYYKDCKKNGVFTSWYDNGKLDEKCYYENGKRNGEYQKWYKNGQLEIKGNYKNGVRDGEFISWYENGELDEKIHFENGVINKNHSKLYDCDTF